MERYKNNVGKRIGGAIYFHRLYLKEMVPTAPKRVINLLNVFIPEGFNIIKYTPKKTISLILSPDFDTATEPTIREIYTYHYDGGVWSYHSYLSDNPPVYHHKWLFVKDDYTGFDVEAAKRRSAYIDSEMNYRGIDRKKIGYLKYWKTLNI